MPLQIELLLGLEHPEQKLYLVLLILMPLLQKHSKELCFQYLIIFRPDRVSSCGRRVARRTFLVHLFTAYHTPN